MQNESIQISQLSAAEIREKLKRGELDPLEVTIAHIDEITKKEHTHGAFMHLTIEAALETARRQKKDSTARHKQPQLWGMPLAHKDLVDVIGSRTTHGSAAFLNSKPAKKDDLLVGQLRALGAINLGKTTVPEFGLSGYSENNISKPARNPQNLKLTAGGSSGGAATAVASNMLPFAPGSDAGGSIRIPAACCAIVGLKPGRDSLPTDANRIQPAPRFTTHGPLARNAIDAAILYDALNADPTETAYQAVMRQEISEEQLMANRTVAAKIAGAEKISAQQKMRIAVTTATPFTGDVDYHLDIPTLTALRTATERLRALDYEVVDTEINYQPGYYEAFNKCWMASFAQTALTAAQLAKLTDYARYAWRRGTLISAADRAKTLKNLLQIGTHAAQQWARFDFVLTPTIAHTPPEIGFFESNPASDNFMLQCQWLPYTSIVNVAGNPAISIPVWKDSNNFVHSVQIIGQPGSEILLLQLAAQIEYCS